MNLKRELRRSAQFDLISFDVFDTLIKRNVNLPTDVFYHVGKEILGDEVKAKVFQIRRIEAEKKSRRQSENGEVCLKDIYRELFVYYGIKACLLKEKEIDFELRNCSSRKNWAELLKVFKEENKKVILISDMYLPSSTINQILGNCGITGYDNLYVSNECGCDKVSGKLFEYARRRENAEGCLHLHYGDSLRADYFGAKKGGAKPVLVFKERWIHVILVKIRRKFKN